MTLTVGFIGLGTMGLPMARHIINRGFKLKLYARRAEVFEGKARELTELGATPCLSLDEVATDVEILITNVTGTDDVESVLIGPEGAMHSASPGTLFIDHSTIDPGRTIEIAQTLRGAGMDFVDAPVSGGVWASEEARLIVMQGGAPDSCERANQVIDCYAKAITRVGDAGHGQIAKLSNQIAQTITIEGVAECLTFAKSLGADPRAVFEAIKDGMGGSQMMSLMAPKMIEEDFSPQSRILQHHKDLEIVLSYSERLGQVLPLTEVHFDLLAQAIKAAAASPA